MDTYDVIVVGLGPGGSSAAYQLARRGRRALGLEKARMPRHKPCGGCLSAKIRTILDEYVEALAEEAIARVIFTFHGEGEIELHSPSPVAYMVSRDTFDHHLAQKAEAAGAEVHDGEAVTGIDPGDDGYVVHTEQGSYRCRFLVGADGVNGVVSRCLGYGPKRVIAVGLEGEVKVEPESFKRMRGTIRLDLGVIPHGYGWIFPKDDHWSLGVGSVEDLPEHPKRYYSAFLEEQGVEDIVIGERRRGYRIPIFASAKSQITQGRSLLVGDAGALVDPFLGEGIYYAIRSGQIAAQTIHAAIEEEASDLSDYQKRISEEIYPEFETAHRVAEFVYRFSRIGYALFKFEPSAGEAFMDVVRGKLSYGEYWNRLKKDVKFGLFEFLSLLKTPADETEATYDRLARQYDAIDFLWKQTLAKGAWRQFEGLVRARLRSGAVVLDAGAGTGETTRALLRLCNPGRVIGIDISSGMLDMARKKFADPRVRFEKADMRRLPFSDNSFDAVVSTWAIETLPDPKAAVSEFLRVIKDDGYVIYAFSSLPGFGVGRLYSFVLEKALGKAFDWRFLSRAERPYHHCQHSSLTSFGGGLMSVVVLRKCCAVEDPEAPCILPESWEMAGISLSQWGRHDACP